MTKRCPKCGRTYTELENYCTKCGIELEQLTNMCSEKKTAMRAHRVYADDFFCEYCGELTEYAKNRM